MLPNGYTERLTMSNLDTIPLSAQILLQRLVYRWLPNIDDYMPTYGDVSPMAPRDVPGLAPLSLWLKENNIPAITGIVVLKATRKPGPDFFDTFYPAGSSINKTVFWKNTISEVKSFDWASIVEAPKPFKL